MTREAEVVNVAIGPEEMVTHLNKPLSSNWWRFMRIAVSLSRRKISPKTYLHSPWSSTCQLKTAKVRVQNRDQLPQYGFFALDGKIFVGTDAPFPERFI